MLASTLIKNSLKHYWRSNLAVVLGVATAVAVLAGALLVGDSVRGSLRDLALARLGKTDFVITATGFFREGLAGDLQSHDQFAASFDGACPLIALEGVVTRDANNARAGGVQVYGVDDRFWKFHGVDVQSPQDNDFLISQSLAQELGAVKGDTLILRIEKHSAIPTESLHGRKDQLGITLRFAVREALPLSSLGEFSLRPQQGAVRAIYAPLAKLQRNLEQDGKANAILLASRNDERQSSQLAAQILTDRFALADLGIRIRTYLQPPAVSLETDSAVINDVLDGKAQVAAEKANMRTASFLTYLANTIRIGRKEIPYSLVTAVEQGYAEGLRPDWQDQIPPIMLNEWAAKDLNAKPGDDVTIEYYVWQEPGELLTKSAQFRVSSISPIRGFAADRNLAPEYPGITEAESLADWDPPFPIDLSRVRKLDEDYWDTYRTTPKTFIRLEDGQKLWATRYGKLTSIRLSPNRDGDFLEAELEATRLGFSRQLREVLDPAESGLAVQSVKEQSLQASRGATDFGEYFTYFSFFLVVSALLLTTLFFKLGIEQRLREIGLLRAVGFSIKQIQSLFLREGFALAVAGSIAGLIGAIGYGALMMFGLRTWWVGAVGTTLLELHITPQALLIGGVSGVATALICIWWTLRSLRAASPRSLMAGTLEDTDAAGGNGVQSTGFSRLLVRRKLPPEGGTTNRSFRFGLIFGLVGLSLLSVSALKLIGQAGGFFGAGSLLLIAILFFWSGWLRSDKRQTIQGRGLWPMMRLGFRNASTRPGRSVLCIALIASAAFIIVSVDAFRRGTGEGSLDPNSGNGGYPLMAETLLPVVHDLNSAQGREELSLFDDRLAGAKITRFRLRPGDDASCLNLYQPRNPRILGAGDQFLRQRRFAFQSSLAASDAEKTNPWLLLDRDLGAGVAPIIVDANSMTYVLHKSLGDEIAATASDGSPIRLRIVAALSDSIFQSELLMSEANFLKFFPDWEGYRVFLIETPPGEATDIAALLEDRLSDFGFDAVSTIEKLAGYHQVENTYLSTFQSLGGLGLLLGTLGLATVLLRNVLERRRELALMRAVGYKSSHLSLMVIAENALLLGCGLLTGVFCALLAIIPALVARGGRLSVTSLGLLLLAVLVTGLAASLIAVRAAVRSPLLASLRTE
jgi:ABC-type antimicrobial peptide transport system permease subunit